MELGEPALEHAGNSIRVQVFAGFGTFNGMGNWDSNEIREFGTGLPDHLELNGVRLDARVGPPPASDLFALFAASEEPVHVGFTARLALTALAG